MYIVSFGAINWDIDLYVDHLPSPDEEVVIHSIYEYPGGTAANVAVASARILGRGKVVFLGALGDDDIGRKQISILKEEGIIVDAVKIAEGFDSGQAYILIDEYGRNMINTYFGANSTIDISYLHLHSVNKFLRKTKVLIITDPPLDTAIEAIKTFSENTLIIWDPGIYVNHGIDKLRRGIRYADIFVINEVESRILFSSVEPKDIKKKVVEINQDAKIIVKRGVEGSMVIDVGGNEVIDIPAVPMDKLGLRKVNTVGCGDAFLGALASYLSEGHTIPESVKMGNCAGAYKATRHETRGSPTREILESICGEASIYMVYHMYPLD